MISRERQKDEKELDLQRIKLHGNNTQVERGKNWMIKTLQLFTILQCKNIGKNNSNKKAV
jgi:hypothetical protein